jgi:hypothetical protein
MNLPYISGDSPPPELPLGRFLPPIPQGMVTRWAEQHLAKGKLVLDPFGFNPLIPIELVKAGYPVLVSANNPIHAFLIRILASAPQRAEMVAALQDLAVTSRGDDRMEPYIRSLYQVKCADCGTLIEVDSFLWKKDATRPHAAIVDCPNCGANGEQLLDPNSPNSLDELPPARLHQARALNRIAGGDDPVRPQVKTALTSYPIRPLIVLQTIINKLEGLEQTPRRKDLLIALILSAADQGNTLWAHPTPRERPRQLTVPPVYQEKNLWKAMENAIDTWQVLTEPIPVEPWTGEIAVDPAIYLFEGRLKELSPLPDPGLIAGVVTAIPRPNQAFWTLSALWTGWIWGQQAVDPIRQVLSRQRYDWNWHTNALRAIFGQLHDLIQPPAEILGLVAEVEPMLLLATLLAADAVGGQLSGFALSLDNEIAQCQFERQDGTPGNIKPSQAFDLAKQAITQYFHDKGEPAHYEELFSAIVTSLAAQNALAMDIFLQNENQAASETEHLIESLFNQRAFLQRVGGGTASLETGIWWLAYPGDTEEPLIDRLEQVIVRHLIKTGKATSNQIRDAVLAELTGIFTPNHSDVLNCLESYADLTDPETHAWTLRDSERPAVRKADIEEMRQTLSQMGQALGYEVQDGDIQTWREPNSAIVAYSFVILASAIVTRHLDDPKNVANSQIILIPGSRANLLAYKKERDPVLKAKLDHGYTLMKYRLVRDLAANPLISRELFREQLLADPPEYQTSQLALF